MTFEDEEDESQTLASSGTVEDPQSIHTLLPEILIDILSRLPIQSLLRCKSVCKSWRSLISHPRFVKYHLSLSNSNSEYAHHRLIMCSMTSVEWCPLHDVIYDKSINTIYLNHPLKYIQKSVWIAGCCNGLLCIVVKYEFDEFEGDLFEGDDFEGEIVFIWNPSTKRSKALPCSGFEGPPFPVYSMGYGECSDDYKVVSIACDINDRGKNDIKVMIYSLKSENWKRIGDFPYRVSLLDSCVSSNGALHWMSFHRPEIISLDLTTEAYGEVLQPVYDRGDKALRLGVLGGWLCLLCEYSESRKMDVWVMKVYGVKDSWTKLASIQNLPHTLWHQFLGPLFIANDEKILLGCASGLVLYDVKNDSFSEIRNNDGFSVPWIVIESLVSPDAPEVAVR